MFSEWHAFFVERYVSLVVALNSMDIKHQN
jgi:hypothetical protein